MLPTTDRRQTDDRQTTDGRAIAYSEREREFTFAKNGSPYAIRPLSVLSVLSVTLVYCGQTVGRFKMKLGTLVGLDPGHIVLDGDPAPLPQGGWSPQCLAHICCGQMAAGIKMPLGMEVGLGPDDSVLDRDPAPPPQKGDGASKLLVHVYCGQDRQRSDSWMNQDS